jgi:hypothetical protein
VVTAPEEPAPLEAGNKSIKVARRRQYRPLEPGEIRRALVDTRTAIGFLGLRWASLAKRAVFGRRR